MTDKPIMIDDVNVAECAYYADGKCTNSHMIQSNCKNVAVCYYKEYKRLEKLLPDINGKFYKAMDDLKAKEQECKEWKHQAELGSDTTDRLAKQLEEKDEELNECREKLHNQLDQLKVENEILEKDKANLDVIIETLKVQFNQLEKENIKLKELVKTRIEDLCDSCGASSMMPMSCKVYEQALKEIMKIAEVQQSWNECNMRHSETESEDDIFAYNWSALNQILQKCEVLKDE